MADFPVPPLPRVHCLLLRDGTTGTGDFKCRKAKTGFSRNRSTTYVQYKKYFSMNYEDKKAIISGFGLVMQISLHKKSTNF